MFKFSKTSLQRLSGVNKSLENIVKDALKLSKIDFSVICGLRTIEEQKKLYAEGKTKTLDSKHLQGMAVDLCPYIKGADEDELFKFKNFDLIAEAIRLAGANTKELNIRWGACWSIDNILNFSGSMESVRESYLEHCKLNRKKPFVDAFHFEIN